MKISYNWLRDYLDIDLPADSLADLLTDIGLEVEGVEAYESIRGGLEGVVVGKVLEVARHPDADKLSVTRVSVGDGDALQIVCGAPNVAAGQTVPVALVGTTLYPGGKPLTLKRARLRGVDSEGMICAEDELGLGDDHAGIMVLDDSLKPGTPLAEVFPVYRDTIFEVGLTPNRSDANHHLGVARDLRAALNYREGLDLNLKWPDVSSLREGQGEPVKVNVLHAEACPRYAGLVLEGLRVGPSPDWLQHRLRAIGQRPINNVVDVTNYIMHEYGQPLHAFDLKAVGGEIRVGMRADGEPFVTLDEAERKLSAEDLMISNASQGMCIAGVFGGLHSGVTASTTAIFLESAYFSPTYIRKTALRHGLRTDAAGHFEKGIDPETTVTALKRAALLLAEVAGGRVASAVTDLYPEPLKPTRVSLNLKQLAKIAGQEIPGHDVRRILELLDIDVVSAEGEVWRLSVAPYRADVTREADVIEEVLRIYGFNNLPVPEKLSASISVTDHITADQVFDKTADYLVANGFYEIVVNSITREKYSDAEGQVRLLNALSAELTVMRRSLLHTGLEVIRHNLNHRNADGKFFELGKQYSREGGEIREDDMLALWVTGRIAPSNWRHTPEDADFFYLKSVAMQVLALLGVKSCETIPYSDRDLSQGMEARLEGRCLVRLGKVSAEALAHHEIDQPVFFAAFDWQTVLQAASAAEVRFRELPKYPSVRRDLALLADEAVPFSEFERLARKLGKGLIREVDLFDVYRDKKMEGGRKSYAISFIFRDDHKTLEDKEVDSLMKQLIKVYKQELNADIR